MPLLAFSPCFSDATGKFPAESFLLFALLGSFDSRAGRARSG